MRLTKIFLAAVMFLSLLAGSLFATAETAPTAPQVTGKPADAKYPFVAEVTGTNVYVRSDKKLSAYACTKLHRPDKVIVGGEESGWAKIMPPRGSYSWIYKAYVKIDPDNPKVGIVTGENVRVWAGADGIEAGRSMGFQVKMNKDPENIDDDDIVELRPDQPETGEYYKIKPPADAYLWISTEFLKYVGPFEQEKPIVIPPKPEIKSGQPVDPANQPTAQPRPKFINLGEKPDPVTPVKVEIQQPKTEGDKDDAKVEQPKPEPPKPVVPKMTEKEIEYTKKCHEAAATIDEELKKPLSIQDYTGVKKTLDKILADKDAGKAATYAKMLNARVSRYELAQSVTKEIQKQDAQLAKARQNIQKARQAQLDKIPAEVKFLYTGQLKASSVYTGKSGPKRYILTDASGKIACYVIAGSTAIDAKLQANLGKQVGVNGGLISTAKSLTAVVSANAVEPITP